MRFGSVEAAPGGAPGEVSPGASPPAPDRSKPLHFTPDQRKLLEARKRARGRPRRRGRARDPRAGARRARAAHYYTKITNWIKRKASAENVSRARAAEAAREAAALARPGPSAAGVPFPARSASPSRPTRRATSSSPRSSRAPSPTAASSPATASRSSTAASPRDAAKPSGAWVAGLRSRPRPLALTFERRDDARIAARRPIKKRGRSEEEEPEETELRLALAASKRAAVASPPGPAKAESTQKKYWRARIDDDLAPRDAALQFVWPNPKSHLTSKSGKKTALAYEAYCTAKSVSEFFAKGGRADELAYDFARGFVAIADDGAELRAEAARDADPPRARNPQAEADGTIDDVPLEPALLGLPPPRPPPPTKRGAEYPEHKNRAHATAELANYLVMKGGTREQVLDWNVAKNQRGDTIFIDPVSGRIFRSKPEVARFLGLAK
ncbi:hypothetical protein JL720_14508 [Aureococcus anophagefferens]|nr:hypothetical protein JL720_14508 [Aureococcus anophagefferens]